MQGIIDTGGAGSSMTPSLVEPYSVVVEIDVTDYPTRSKYAPLYVTQTVDNDIVIAKVTIPINNELEQYVPTQFMMILGSDIARIPLETSDALASFEVRWVAGTAYLDDLIARVQRSQEFKCQELVERTLEECCNTVIGYKLYGRALGGKWIEYAHGPLLFKCPLVEDYPGSTNPEIRRPGGEIGTPQTIEYGGPFMKSDFAPQFMSSKSDKS